MEAIKAVPQSAIQGRFKERPGKYVIEAFVKWVAETGRPDTWEHHDASRPPKDQDFEELIDFAVPEKLRSIVGMATCPICSPLAPKYFEGTLAYFHADGVLRAIGRDCAESHFGSARATAAKVARMRFERRTLAEEFLLETLPKVESIRAEVLALEPLAKIIDQLQQTFWRRTSKPDCVKLAKLGAGGILVIDEAQSISVTDGQGNETTQHIPREIARYNVVGLEFLRRKASVASLVRNTGEALKHVRAANEDQALELLVGELSNDEYLFVADKLTRAAIKEYHQLIETFEDARAFFRPANLRTLTEWSGHRLSPSPIVFVYKDRDKVYVRSRMKGGGDVPIPACVR